MNKTGIITLFPEEYRLLKDTAVLEGSRKAGNVRFFEGDLGGRDIVFASPDIETSAVASATQAMIDCYDPPVIFYSGLAYTMVPFIENGDLIISSLLTVANNRNSLFELDQKEYNHMIDIDGDLVDIMRTAAKALGSRDPQTIFGSLIEASRNELNNPRTRNICKKMGVMGADRLGCAFARTCRANNSRFIIIDAAASDESGLSSYPQTARFDTTIDKLFNLKLICLTEMSRLGSSIRS